MQLKGQFSPWYFHYCQSISHLCFVSAPLLSLPMQFLLQWRLVFPTFTTSNVYAYCHKVNQLKTINFNLLSLSLLRKISQSVSWHTTDNSQIHGRPLLPKVCTFNLTGFSTAFKSLYKQDAGLPWSGWKKIRILKFQRLFRLFKVS